MLLMICRTLWQKNALTEEKSSSVNQALEEISLIRKLILRKVALLGHPDNNLMDETVNVSYVAPNMFDNHIWIGLNVLFFVSQSNHSNVPKKYSDDLDGNNCSKWNQSNGSTYVKSTNKKMLPVSIASINNIICTLIKNCNILLICYQHFV